jgi:DNA-directed RNA polymerase specialized sigma subunit
LKNLLERCKAAGCTSALTKEDNYKLYERVRAGDDDAKREMIEGNMSLVMVRVNWYLRKCPQMNFIRDDLISAGFIGLCTAVNQMETSPKDIVNPIGYMYTIVDRFVTREADEETTIKVPQRSQQRHHTKGMELEIPTPVSSQTAEVIFAKMEDRDHTLSFDIRDELNACCRDDYDRCVIAMVCEEYLDIEIGEVLGLTRAMVQRMKARIFQTFRDRWEALND